MVKIAAYLIIGLVVGFAVASLTDTTSSTPGFESADTAKLESRLVAIEAALDDERRNRLRLEQQLSAVEDAFDEWLAPTTADTESQDLSELASVARSTETAREPGRGNADFGRRGGSGEAQIDRFIVAGIPAERAQWIVQRTSELRMEALEARYAAIRDGDPAGRNRIDTEQTLRAELGDTVYEQYLNALGRPTQVGIGSVLASSPAERAGIQPGDQVLAYAGRRVFDMDELTRMTFEGQPGESIAVDILRDGQQIQLYLPRGPIGITGARRSGRRP